MPSRPGRGRAGCRSGSHAGWRRTSSLRSRPRRSGFRSISSPTLETLGQPAPGAEVMVSAANWASEQVPRPAATEGLTRHPLRQGEHGLLDLGGGAGRRVDQRTAVAVEGEVIAGRRGGAVGREDAARDRVEGQRIAILHRFVRGAGRGRRPPCPACTRRWHGCGRRAGLRRRSAGSGRPGSGATVSGLRSEHLAWPKVGSTSFRQLPRWVSWEIGPGRAPDLHLDAGHVELLGEVRELAG